MVTETYAKSQGEENFDWNKFLNKEKFTSQEIDYAEKLAGNWVTCACGNMCAVIPRDEGRPIDKKLRKLGEKFAENLDAMESHFVDKDEYTGGMSKEELKDRKDEIRAFERARKSAITTLEKIEVRSLEVMREYFLSLEPTMKALGLKLIKK